MIHLHNSENRAKLVGFKEPNKILFLKTGWLA
jgi:hypothetical protein